MKLTKDRFLLAEIEVVCMHWGVRWSLYLCTEHLMRFFSTTMDLYRAFDEIFLYYSGLAIYMRRMNS